MRVRPDRLTRERQRPARARRGIDGKRKNPDEHSFRPSVEVVQVLDDQPITTQNGVVHRERDLTWHCRIGAQRVKREHMQTAPDQLTGGFRVERRVLPQPPPC